MVSGPRGRDLREEIVEESFTPPSAEYWGDDVSFPSQDMADRWEYGSGQHRSQYNEPFYNPEVMERQLGLDQFPGAASNAARINNAYYQTGRQRVSSPQEVRDITGWRNALKSNPELVDPMYRDMYKLEGPQESVDMWKSKREQIEDAREEGIYGEYVADMMEDYGRDNPYLQELGGTFIGPRGEEEYRDEGYDVRLPGEVSEAYGYNLDSNDWPYGVRPPSGRPGGMDWRDPFPPSDIGYDRAGPAPDPEWPNTPPPGWELEPPAGRPPYPEEYWNDIGDPPPVSLVNKPRGLGSFRHYFGNIGHSSPKMKHQIGMAEGFEKGFREMLKRKQRDRRTQSRIAQRTTPRSTSDVEDHWYDNIPWQWLLPGGIGQGLG